MERDGLDPEVREALEVALYCLMSEWSEDVYAAGWFSDLERLVVPWCREHLEDQKARAMMVIADLLGYWLKYDAENEKGYAPVRLDD